MTIPTAPAEDGGLWIDPKIARVLILLRESVAQATERAYRELVELGVPNPEDWLRGRRNKRQISDRL